MKGSGIKEPEAADMNAVLEKAKPRNAAVEPVKPAEKP